VLEAVVVVIKSLSVVTVVVLTVLPMVLTVDKVVLVLVAIPKQTKW
jgi:hypothetical protein